MRHSVSILFLVLLTCYEGPPRTVGPPNGTAGPAEGEAGFADTEVGPSATGVGPSESSGPRDHDDGPPERDVGSTASDVGRSDDTGGMPVPSAPCPAFVDGVVTFCLDGLDECRSARVLNVAGASGSGPLALHWHGTYESPELLLDADTAALAILAMVEAERGLMVLPYADRAAVTRRDTPFPWWVVCGSSGTDCDRLDDFRLADEIVACAVEQGLVDPQRVTTSGMSAGAIMASHLVDRVPYLAGAVLWSGGLPPAYQPATPAGNTPVMGLHGGSTDLYCGPGALGGDCYEFWPVVEAFVADVAAAGNFAFLCDHQAGHAAAMGPEGAQFLALAHASGHPWAGHSFGTDGHWSTGSSWVLDHYCYLPGQPSPWR